MNLIFNNFLLFMGNVIVVGL